VRCFTDTRVQDESQASQPGNKVEVHPPRTTVHLQHDTNPRLVSCMWVQWNNGVCHSKLPSTEEALLDDTDPTQKAQGKAIQQNAIAMDAMVQ
jgi:hypothetical protein